MAEPLLDPRFSQDEKRVLQESVVRKRQKLAEIEAQPLPKATLGVYVKKGTCIFWTGAAFALACVVLVAVVPPVCVLKGCGQGGSSEGGTAQPNRLIVDFATVNKTVASLVPPLLLQYLQEQVLVSSGINVVSFSDESVLQEVRKLIETQPDLQNLLRDMRGYTPPVNDAIGAPGTARARLLRDSPAARRALLQLRTPGAEDEFIAEMWQKKFVRYDDAWNMTQGTADVVVAVIDTGCDLTHPDLRGNLWTNPGEIPGNGVDDDGNGYVDDVYGYDFAGNCEEDWTSARVSGCGAKADPQDVHSHGTHCAGIVAALRGNGIGVAGVAPRVKVMCLKVATPGGAFYTSHILKAYDYAVRMGAHVASCSFGPAEPNLSPGPGDVDSNWRETKFYQTALEPLAQKNMLIVAAAGNENTRLEELDAYNTTYNPCFMARYFPENMLCVMATNESDARWFEIAANKPVGSNYGKKYTDIGAPGRAIFSTVPPLLKNGFVSYYWKTGSSMATPMTAGTAALVLSVLGKATGNYFQGSAARRILVSSADRVVGLPVRTEARINAAAAVRQARAQLAGLVLLVPQTAFRLPDQALLVAGFNETYFAGDIGLEDQDLAVRTVYDRSTRTGVSRFDSYKYGTGYTLNLRASVHLPKQGVYAMRINTQAPSTSLRVLIGQTRLTNLSSIILLNSEGGWYELEIRYVNPTLPIDIRLADPDAGVGADAFAYPEGVFFTATPGPPRPNHFAPNIALSSVYQVLTREVDPANLTRASIAAGPHPLLQLDQPYTFSSVLPDLVFGGDPAALQAQLYPAAAGFGAAATPPPAAVVGMAHSRLRPPERPMRFRVTCQLCSLYVDTLQVVDVYDPAGDPLQPTTRTSGCLAFSPTLPAHDLVLRFALKDTAAAALTLAWLPCEGAEAGEAASLTSHLASNLLWKPSSGVAGYVPGMQCDLWPDPGPDPRPYPFLSQPWLRVRLPMALGHVPRAFGVAPGFVSSWNANFTTSGCSAANESFGSACFSGASFNWRDVFYSMPTTSGFAGTAMATVYARCFTYINRGFRTGAMQVRASNGNNAYAYLGAQNVFRSDARDEDRGPYQAASVAPNRTALDGHYQLLALEYRGSGVAALFGVLDGVNFTDNLWLDMRSTLLPIPLVAEREPVLVGSSSGPAAATASTASTGPSPSEGAGGAGPAASTSGGADANAGEGQAAASPPPAYGLPGPAAAGGSAGGGAGGGGGGGAGGGGARRVAQARPVAGAQLTGPGSSDYTLDQLGSPGLTVNFYGPNPAAHYETVPGMAGSMVSNISTSPLLATLPATAGTGLQLTVSGPAELAGQRRYMRMEGFLRSPTPEGSAGARVWVLRVRDGDAGQAVSVTFGNVTVRNGPEFPARTLTETHSEVALPPGYIPAVILVRSMSASADLTLDVALLDPASGAPAELAWRASASAWSADPPQPPPPPPEAPSPPGPPE
ncbi:hypothetical protein HYH03_006574 [Edaphochlamys debaryana]|uniref:Peptidase S8/S53 domain-containing protein n=1 Tax=Edaphochlamys debaryana TaxID=47281 RepID=A0A835Y2G9_9CHLO|nr:hypothetical protein HYH03_006574 [Edaphochlamys debaryana]|eukprot:KAG2495302.1 hypothetical protein HYH03_006574 [Edaphochlamys debaryana]